MTIPGTDISPFAMREGQLKVICLQLLEIVAAIGLAACWNAWTLLWLMPTILLAILLLDIPKRSYWRGFDPFIWKASEDGRFGKVVWWNSLTYILDWVFSGLPMAAGAYFVFALASDIALPGAVRWVFLSFACYPPLARLTGHMNPFRQEVTAGLFILPILFAIVSAFHPLTPNDFAVACAAYLLVTLPIRIIRTMSKTCRRFEKIRQEFLNGFIHTNPYKRQWFPRPGVVFEPQYSCYFPYPEPFFNLIKTGFTILRVNWCGAITSIVLLIAGVTMTGRSGHSGLILLSMPLTLAGFMYLLVASAFDREGEGAAAVGIRGILTSFLYAGFGALVIYFGGRDLRLLVALGMLFPSAWFIFIGFIVRAKTESLFDTLDYYFALGAVASVIAGRYFAIGVWWETLLPVILIGVSYAHIRNRWRRTDLPEVQAESPSADAAVPEAKKTRRDRKRERQIAALRRSQRRDV